MLGLEVGWKVDWLKENGLKSMTLGYLTPHTSLGLKLFSLIQQFSFTMIAAESFQIDMGIYEVKSLVSCSLRAVYNQEAYGPCSHEHRRVESAKLHCKSGTSGLQSSSPRLWHIHWYRDASCLGCANTPVKLNALCESRRAGMLWEESMFYTGFGIKSRFIFQRSSLAVFKVSQGGALSNLV